MKSKSAHKSEGACKGDQPVGGWSLLAPSPTLDHASRANDEPLGPSVSKDELSAEELTQIWEFHCNLVGENILTYAAGGALWQKLEGLVADLPIGPLLRMVEDIVNDTPPILSEEERAKLVTWIGKRVVVAMKSTDAEFFLQLGTVLKARREGRSFASLTAKELGIARRRGRKPQGADLSRVFPLAVIKVTMRRNQTAAAAEDEFTRKRITRNELLLAIRALQGVKFVISDSELSRWITRYGLNPFMERA